MPRRKPTAQYITPRYIEQNAKKNDYVADAVRSVDAAMKQAMPMHSVRLITLLVLNYLTILATKMRLITVCGWFSGLSLKLMQTHLERESLERKADAFAKLSAKERDEVVRASARNALRRHGLPENAFDQLPLDEVVMQVEGLRVFHELESKPVEERKQLWRELESGDDRKIKKILKRLERSAKAKDGAH